MCDALLKKCNCRYSHLGPPDDGWEGEDDRPWTLWALAQCSGVRGFTPLVDSSDRLLGQDCRTEFVVGGVVFVYVVAA